MTNNQEPRLHGDDEFDEHEPTRAEESRDVAEADAPTAEEENIGVNTILGGGFLTGVQNDWSDE